MVGHFRPDILEYYGNLLAKYFDDDNTVFVVSSDFCHWGSRFNYTYYNQTDGAIHESIEKLDRRGMSIIESQNATYRRQVIYKTCLENS